LLIILLVIVAIVIAVGRSTRFGLVFT